ncbi:unnamed protein product [Parascedosporium putredinis]|uniref:Uncharacterized protein n=1 Tax=Parascedosporium putredinis TaxID=1442378 RepID=A0A9P1MDF9_9PEZI|nr:unnamed protein product [Parascedosporium putredinis]CAI8000393.1 unnamed protein product [Parascedosporium putredinis]
MDLDPSRDPFTPAQEDVLRIFNLLIQTAIFIGMVLLTADGEIHPIEPVITIWLIFGALSSVSGSGLNPIGRLSGLFRVLLYSGVAGYACWFWWIGLDTMGDADADCQTIAFFGGISINGRFRLFNKVAAIAGGTICLVFLCWNVSAMVKRLNGNNYSGSRRRARVQIELLAISLTIIAISVAAIEYLLDANNITEIDNVVTVGGVVYREKAFMEEAEVLGLV